MKASEMWDETGYEFHRSNEQIMKVVKEHAQFGFAYAIFMEHEITGPQRTQLRRDGYKIKRSHQPNKIEVSWEGGSP